MLGASGGVELMLTVLAIRDSVIPPTINLRKRPTRSAIWTTRPSSRASGKIKAAMTNSFGFGGHNGSLLVASPPNGKHS